MNYNQVKRYGAYANVIVTVSFNTFLIYMCHKHAPDYMLAITVVLVPTTFVIGAVFGRTIK